MKAKKAKYILSTALNGLSLYLLSLAPAALVEGLRREDGVWAALRTAVALAYWLPWAWAILFAFLTAWAIKGLFGGAGLPLGEKVFLLPLTLLCIVNLTGWLTFTAVSSL
ncbi:MAG: hypothetical protein Q4C72_00590 [Eubacteriales bacterium]|nr:hypothetical protein [Eubacteriales bacterium]